MSQPKTANETNPTPATRTREVIDYSPPSFDGPTQLRLDRNEGRPAPAWPDRLGTFLVEATRRYPNCSNLQEMIAARHDLPDSRVLIGSGADDILQRICQAYLDPGSEIILPSPTFEMISTYSRLAGGHSRFVEWNQTFPLEEVFRAVTPQTRIIAVVSPNNPTGLTIRPEELLRLSRELPRQLLLVDLAYIEFADIDLTPIAVQCQNAVVVRTFSKAWGLAGLRVGYALGSESTIELLRRVGNPYPVSSFSLSLVETLLNSGLSCEAHVQEIRAEREQLQDGLKNFGIDTLPSQANFVFFRHRKAKAIWKELGRRGIAVRWFGDAHELRDALRITCPGDKDEFRFLQRELALILGSHDFQ